MTDFPSSLRSWCLDVLRVTKPALAEMIGTTEEHIRNLESGRARPTPVDLGLLAGIGFVLAQEGA